MSKLHNLLDLSSTASKTLKDASDVGTRLHTDDSELVLLIHPNQESLILVMENTATVWPVAIQAASLQESVSLPKILIDMLT